MEQYLSVIVSDINKQWPRKQRQTSMDSWNSFKTQVLLPIQNICQTQNVSL